MSITKPQQDSTSNVPKGHLIVYFDRNISSHKLPSSTDEDESDHSLAQNISDNTDTYWYFGKIPSTKEANHVIAVPSNLFKVETHHLDGLDLSIGGWEEKKWSTSVAQAMIDIQHQSSNNAENENDLTSEEAAELHEQNSLETQIASIESSQGVTDDYTDVVLKKLSTIIQVSNINRASLEIE